MPFSSRVLTSEASVYRGGGSVKCCVGVMDSGLMASPSVSTGRWVSLVSVG